ncbi:MAG: hypothetical protein JSS76_11985 [Bacteroidetes bacterium]|nr:hypothetical protein [Bacteroidota bacterium]
MNGKSTFVKPQIELFNEQDLADAKKEFNAIYSKVNSNKTLLESEKSFFCNYLPSFLPGKVMADFAICANERFKSTYLLYWYDITGGSKYYKPDLAKIDIVHFNIDDVKLHPELYKTEISRSEVDKSLKYLYDEAKQWEMTLKATAPGSNLWCLWEETKAQLLLLDELPEFKFDFYMRGTRHYFFRKTGILLQSKYVYHLTQESIEGKTISDFTFLLNHEEIELSECGIYHILSRHYSALTKQLKVHGKSYHNGDFHHNLLSIQIRDIFEIIENSGVYLKDSIAKISFIYKGVHYCIRTGKRLKRPNGVDNFVRVKTFYPIINSVEMKILAHDYVCVKLTDEISVYCKK